jgi:hypothetical protein
VGARLRQVPLAAIVVASIAFGFVQLWPELGRQHARYGRLSPREVRLAGAIHEHLDAARIDGWRKYAKPGVRYCVRGDFVTLTFATYFLLPALPAGCGDADVILR